MRKIFFVIAAVLLCSIPQPALAAKEEVKISFSAGKRVDNLDWSIAGGGVNILSELTWKDLESYQLKGRARIYIGRVYLRGQAAYAFIVSGENQDSDYAGNNRTNEISRSENRSDSGDFWDLSGGVGYVFRPALTGGRLAIAPIAGLSYHRQNLTITDGFQTVTSPGFPPLGPFPGLDSTYSASWAGPWAGVDIEYAYKRLTVSGSLEYHVAYYNAVANWNLRADFAHPNSFEHWADGSGVVVSLGAEYALDDRWSLAGSFDLQDWSTSSGTDRTYFAAGGAADTRLNGVNWDSRAFSLGLNYRF
ncbi:MAG: outer membrane beta-barrel protein [Deltaproteobacteria bacterium]|nr:outer membrane beta-barrel protein [Deltaproteobacteria bacterium]MBZ0218892.1 outer membrane beta-barrel protein [Deltaproteobacteria bacterium]